LVERLSHCAVIFTPSMNTAACLRSRAGTGVAVTTVIVAIGPLADVVGKVTS
jgi:hypothetical protein